MNEFDGIRPVRLVAGRIRWNGRLAANKLRKLYENDAAGIHDEELLDDVAVTFYARCVSIKAATSAHYGDVTCARCLTIIKRRKWARSEPLVCSGCGWESDWGTYLQSYQKRQLFSGAAHWEYVKFMEDYPSTEGYAGKMRVVDRIVHAFHIDLQRHSVGRPAPVNLVEGSFKSTLRLLDELAFGDASTSGVSEARTKWSETIERAPWVKHIKFRDGD